MRKRNKFKHALYLVLALAMLLYALPRLSPEGPAPVFVFGLVWVVFALLVIAAHLHFIIGVDEEKTKRMEAVRKAKLEMWQEKWSKEGRAAQRL
ncbi:hypothetical protein J2Z22_000656 [Paenibacillus forsythiae]|uniref:Uncharacterized protein n=1 Tax=Paenibacillus forsythiae TaxID=365616 RepID=A0ABU3H2U3_9BACL|nr:hypothetical protein [Paenibacillus forsythiae]MDT3425143.1 hypothetical protein [Paenibacillus forsythiae]